ncbi:high-affinity iron permease [Geranomyces variabilis]|uniref:High-affinity iron permease n=1 Tax=Geranomyces variabilis TaxID=109894 RepID=A0AAD5TT48_9FUNG|nr:high-affinity iron permease [Geranomyces variabilis]
MLFSVAAFFVIWRETTEAAIVVSVLLSFCSQMFGQDPIMYKRLRRQIWLGSALGLGIVLIVSAAVIGVFYALDNNIWSAHEFVWEGTLALIAAVIITYVGVIMLKSSRIEHQEKWRLKLMREMEVRKKGSGNNSQESDETAIDTTTNNHASVNADGLPPKKRGGMLHRVSPRLSELANSEKYALFFIPFITILREGIEAVVFMFGVGVSDPPSSLPIAVIAGLVTGALLGWIIYAAGSRIKLKYFFLVSTCFLFLVAAGLFSRAIRSFESEYWNRSLLYPSGSGDDGSAPPIAYTNSLWWLDCCDYRSNGWSIFNALLGWNEKGSVGTVTGYCLYWVALSTWLVGIKIVEKRRAAAASTKVARHEAMVAHSVDKRPSNHTLADDDDSTSAAAAASQ